MGCFKHYNILAVFRRIENAVEENISTFTGTKSYL